MSIYFIVEGSRKDIWNPSSASGRLFCAQVESVGKLLSTDPGLGPIVSDEVIVDPERFGRFVDLFAVWFLKADSGSATRALLEGCFAIAAALSQKMGGRLSEEVLVGRFVENGIRIVSGAG